MRPRFGNRTALLRWIWCLSLWGVTMAILSVNRRPGIRLMGPCWGEKQVGASRISAEADLTRWTATSDRQAGGFTRTCWRGFSESGKRPYTLIWALVGVAFLVGWGCSTGVDAWQTRCGAAFRAQIEVVQGCLDDATTVAQSCEMRFELALRKRSDKSEAYQEALKNLEQLECGDVSLRARLLRGEALLAGGAPLGALEVFRSLIVEYPGSYAAGEAVRAVSGGREAIGAAGLSTSEFYLGAYGRVKERRVAGHLLFYAVKDKMAEGTMAPRQALGLLLMLVDYHPESPLWDEGAVWAADLLRQMGKMGDEVRFLEEVLLPNRARGMDQLLDGFAQRLRLRLAALYGRQGRFDDALIQLGWVINSSDQRSLKDDGLWLAYQIQSWKGDQEGARRTLEFLVRECPWSRHVERARAELKQMF